MREAVQDRPYDPSSQGDPGLVVSPSLLHAYVSIARPGHWFKNIFMLPGVVLAALLTKTPFAHIWLDVLLAFASACLVASSNYVINEWLDADSDRFHPLKRHRPAVQGILKRSLVWTEYGALLVAGLGIAFLVSARFAAVAVLFAVMAWVYNVEPVRAKDRAVMDVLTESINNPIRLLLGWYAVVPGPFPPSSLLLGYWMAGAFLMAVKRYGEMRFLRLQNVAEQYRRSFQVYTEETLLISLLFYASAASFFLGVFLVKYRVELIVSLPFLAVLFAWYLHLGLKQDSPAQRPERLWRETWFALYFLFVVGLLWLLFVTDIQWLSWFLKNVFLIYRPQ